MLWSVETKHQESCRIKTGNPKDTSWQTCQAMLTVLRSFCHIVRDYSGSEKLIPSIIWTKLGPVTYSMAVSHGRVMQRHIDKLRQKTDFTTIMEIVQQADSIIQDNYKYLDPPKNANPSSKEWQYPEQVRPPSDRTSDCEHRTLFWFLAGELELSHFWCLVCVIVK